MVDTALKRAKVVAKRILKHTPLTGVRGVASFAAERRLRDCVVNQAQIAEARTLRSEVVHSPSPILTVSLPPATLYELRGVRLWARYGLVSYRGRILVDLAGGRSRLDGFLRREPTFFRLPVARVAGVVATINDHLSTGYYHWLIDDLPRLYGLHSEAAAGLKEIQVLRPVGVHPAAPGFEETAGRILRALLPHNARLIDVPSTPSLLPERYLHLPYLSGEMNAHLPPEFLTFFRQRVRRELGIQEPARRRRILISRRLAAQRRLLNEEELVKRLAPLGFESVTLETLPLEEQVRLLAGADVVVALHGAGIANTLFGTECKIVEIHPGPPRHHLRWLALAVGHEYAEVTANAESKNADINAPIDEVLECLVALGVR